jgi:hypothetical protein
MYESLAVSQRVFLSSTTNQPRLKKPTVHVLKFRDCGGSAVSSGVREIFPNIMLPKATNEAKYASKLPSSMVLLKLFEVIASRG